MNVAVRWATVAEAEGLALMLREMAVHYRQPTLAEEAALAAARRWLAEESPAYPHFALAYREGEVAGLASVAIAHPGLDLNRLLFLKDLYVRDESRSAGVGRAILQFLAEQCLERGIARIDLTTEDWNEGALRFYEQLGAQRRGQKVFLRFDAENLRGLAGEG